MEMEIELLLKEKNEQKVKQEKMEKNLFYFCLASYVEILVYRSIEAIFLRK